MDIVSLRADCGRCAGLCCVALAFDRSELFAIDKGAGVCCPNLDRCGRCVAHDRLEAEGFAGCVRYDCLGAGQRVVQEMFGGRSWLEDEALLRPMMDAFMTLRVAHQHLRLLASITGLCASEDAQRVQLALAVQKAGASAVELERLAGQISGWLRGLGREAVAIGVTS